MAKEKKTYDDKLFFSGVVPGEEIDIAYTPRGENGEMLGTVGEDKDGNVVAVTDTKCVKTDRTVIKMILVPRIDKGVHVSISTASEILTVTGSDGEDRNVESEISRAILARVRNTLRTRALNSLKGTGVSRDLQKAIGGAVAGNPDAEAKLRAFLATLNV